MNIAYRFRIYPTEEQKILLGKTFGCCRFLYNQMLNDKIREYEKTKKMLKNTPAMYKKEYPFLKEIDSLALANVQLHLEKAYKNFFRDPKIGFPRFKSKHHSKNSYTTNVVNGNILGESKPFADFVNIRMKILIGNKVSDQISVIFNMGYIFIIKKRITRLNLFMISMNNRVRKFF